MIKIILSIGVLFIICCVASLDFESVYAYKTGSYNFCIVFPTFPDCVGWRTEAISDSYNYWFCDYVYLPDICENPPDEEKKITLRTEDFCCRFIGLEPITPARIQDRFVEQILGKNSSDSSIAPLIIWTDKDHYNFRDKVTVYGKFDFTKIKIKKSVSEKEFDQTGRQVEGTSIQTGRIISETPVLDIDVKLNGNRVLKNIPVYENGWFATFFYLDNQYTFSNQNNLLEIDYILYEDVPLGGPRTHATYHFTTGSIVKKDDRYDVWIDKSDMPNTIHYGVKLENPERFLAMMQEELVITRVTTPNGYVIQIPSNYSIKDISNEYSGFTDYGHGTYEIQVTYGDNVSKAVFEY